MYKVTVALLSIIVLSSCTNNEEIIVGWGDSMMKGSGSEISILDVIEDELGVRHKNFGEGGLWSSQVAVLQGAHTLSLKVEDSIIDPWGTVKLEIDGAQPFNSFGPQEYEGRLNDISGELVRVHSPESREVTSHFEFKRGVSFFEKEVEEPFLFSFDNATDYTDSMIIIWAGRNDDKSGNKGGEIVENLEDMINYLSPKSRNKTLILSVCNAKSDIEGKGTIPYERIIDLNQKIKERLPDYYIDVRKYMVEKAIYDMGITPKPDDLEAIGNDAIPGIFFKDHVHFNELGNRALGLYLSGVIKQRGWME